MAPSEKSLGAVVVSSLVGILARSAPRSERDPDLEATTAKLAMHPVTGTFADPALELAFAAQLFPQLIRSMPSSWLSWPLTPG